MGGHPTDEQRRMLNEAKGEPLCKRCDGTGNELWGMRYRACQDCGGSGVAPKVTGK